MSKQLAFCFLVVWQVSTLIGAPSKNDELPSPYRDVEELLPFSDHGWYGNAVPMERLFKEYPIKTVIEVGSWLGLSTRHLATLVPEGGVVYAVDHWQGSSEHQAETKVLSTLYQQFLSNTIHAGLTHKIIPIRMDSLEAAQSLKVVPDMIYVDASHETDAVYRDLTAWFPLVKGHGILCGDDWWWRTVREAVILFAQENNLRLIVEGGFWYYTETR